MLCSLLFWNPQIFSAGGALTCANPIHVTQPSNALLCGAVSAYLWPVVAAAAAAVHLCDRCIDVELLKRAQSQTSVCV